MVRGSEADGPALHLFPPAAGLVGRQHFVEPASFSWGGHDVRSAVNWLSRNRSSTVLEKSERTREHRHRMQGTRSGQGGSSLVDALGRHRGLIDISSAPARKPIEHISNIPAYSQEGDSSTQAAEIEVRPGWMTRTEAER
ncbi:hypothetical protein BC834DRAFT_480625 [Gloeopeniophorella convolvens]|nr:hypothetical protein BC834DRAFT_480625 [Gloeopeniophorella convolvens]